MGGQVSEAGELPMFGRYPLDSTHFPGLRKREKEEMSDLQSTRIAQVSPLKRILAQLVIVFSLRLVRIILSREGVVFYSYRER
jgi:hypothetical protein